MNDFQEIPGTLQIAQALQQRAEAVHLLVNSGLETERALKLCGFSESADDTPAKSDFAPNVLLEHDEKTRLAIGVRYSDGSRICFHSGRVKYLRQTERGPGVSDSETATCERCGASTMSVSDAPRAILTPRWMHADESPK